MISITIGQEKGGIGKTTLAVTLAAGLAIRGAQVLLVDTDAQASATVALGQEDSPALYDVLIRGEPISRAVMEISSVRVHGTPSSPGDGYLHLLPANVEARNIAGMLEDLDVVARRFAEVEDQYNVVVFDTPPTPSLFHAAIYTASDYIVWPVVPEPLAMDGLVKSMGRLKGIAHVRQGMGKAPTIPLGIVPTLVRSGTVLHQVNLQQLRQEHGALVKAPISQRIAWSEAAQMGKSIFASSSSDVAVDEAWRFVDEVLEGIHARQA